MLTPVLTWNVGTVRAYDCNAEEDAELAYESRQDFAAIFEVRKMACDVAVLSGMLSLSRVGRGFVLRVVKLLWIAGIKHVYIERAKGRSMPFGVTINEGPMQGHWYWDIELILAGQGLDY